MDLFLVKKGESMEGCPLMLNVDYLEGKKWKSFSMMSSGLTTQFFFFSCILFVNWVRVYIEDDTSSMIDFVDWLLKKLGKRKKKASFYFSHFIQTDYCIDINT